MLLLLCAVRDIEIAGVFPVWAIVLILGFMAAVLVAVTSKADKPPVYHCVSSLSLSLLSLTLSLSLSLSLYFAILCVKHLLLCVSQTLASTSPLSICLDPQVLT